MQDRGEFFPINRWVTGLTILLVSYVAYISAGSMVENTLPTILKGMTTNPWVNEVIDSTTLNFWYGVVIIFLGLLLYLMIAGIPGTEVERYEGL